MTSLGSPLVVFRDTTLCDGKHHEVELITDGARAYAWNSESDTHGVRRDGTTLYVTCRQPVGSDGDPCDGEAEFDLTREAWTADPESIHLLTQHGETVDR